MRLLAGRFQLHSMSIGEETGMPPRGAAQSVACRYPVRNDRCQAMVRWGVISSVPQRAFFPCPISLVGLVIIAGASSASAQTGSHTVSAMSGELLTVQENSISIRNDQATRTFQIGKNTRIWRGHFVDVHHLRLGDAIDLRYRVSASGAAIATAVWANIDRWAGTITENGRESPSALAVG
jgi:hypothetical protein